MNPSTDERHERLLALLFCLAAMAHALVYAAAFPFFNIADEPYHLDLVIRYSRGDLPRSFGPLATETLPYIAAYATPEYLNPAGQYRPPPWRLPPDQAVTNMLRLEASVSHWQNAELSQPPLYYALAAAWWRGAQKLGFGELLLLYVARFFNALVIAAIVWVGFGAARLVFPGDRFARLAVPALLAFVPQTAFYGIENDVLSPLSFGLVFICVVRWLRSGQPGVRLGVATGLAIASCYLTKISNLPLLVVAAGALALSGWRLWRAGRLHTAWLALGAMVLCAGLPICLWLGRTKHLFGDFTGSNGKIQLLGWTLKPLAEWWRHPIFTPHGAWTFASGLLGSFWQEAFFWHNQPVRWRGLIVGYTFLSLGFLGVALWNLRPRCPGASAQLRQALGFAALSFAAGVAFLALLSIPFDFGRCEFPSRQHPYFTAGRLLSGAWIPFALVFVYGFTRALDWTKSRRIAPWLLTTLILALLLMELATNWPVFFSQYNLLHL